MRVIITISERNNGTTESGAATVDSKTRSSV